MRHPDDVVYSVTLTPDEQDFAEHMMQLTGIAAPSDFLRLGLFHLAKHLDVPIGNAIFALTGARPIRLTREERSAIMKARRAQAEQARTA